MGVGSECGRRIHLRQQTIANGWTLRTDRDAGALDQCDEASDGETVRTPTWPRALVPAAPAISFPSSRKVTPCHHLPRTKTYRSNNYVRTRWDRSTEFAPPNDPPATIGPPYRGA